MSDRPLIASTDRLPKPCRKPIAFRNLGNVGDRSKARFMGGAIALHAFLCRLGGAICAEKIGCWVCQAHLDDYDRTVLEHQETLSNG